jgi:antirestriction protein ArdC
MKNANHNSRDLYQTITDRLVAAIEAGAPTFEMPWHSKAASTLPENVLTKKAYRGINILSLWVSQIACGFRTNKWATYRQWQERGAQVRKGEKSSLVIFYKEHEREIYDAESGQNETGKFFVAHASYVFNADQVDGYTAPELPVLEDKTAILEAAERFVQATQADVKHGGVSAYYSPQADSIQMPDRGLFIGTKTSSPTEAYYSTLLHELTHWTSHVARVNRQLSKRFGDHSYAMEELIAEFGAAFLCANLGISLEPRADHAAYLDLWLKVAKADKKALFTAASKASEAVDFLAKLQPVVAGAAAQHHAA